MILKQHGGSILGVLTVLCWSSYNIAAKHGIEAGMSPQALAFLRFSVPGVIAVPLLLVLYARGKSTGIPLGRLCALTMLGGPIFGVVAVSGYVHAPLSHGLLFAPVAVFLTGSLLGHMLIGEGMPTNQIAGAAVMFAGLATLVGLDVVALTSTWVYGAALFVLAGSMWGGYTVLLRLWRIPMIEGTLTVAGGSAMIALPVLGLTAHSSLQAATPSAVALQVFMQGIVGGCLSVVALIGAVRSLPLRTAALLPVFTPVAALCIVAIVFGKAPSKAEMLGSMMVATGFLISLRKKNDKGCSVILFRTRTAGQTSFEGQALGAGCHSPNTVTEHHRKRKKEQ